jgi:DNA replication protein DnaC
MKHRFTGREVRLGGSTAVSRMPDRSTQDRLLERRHKLAHFRHPERSLDTFDFDLNKKMNRALVYELATVRFIAQRKDARIRSVCSVGS